MSLDKTLTIRKRTVNIYLPNLEMKERWATVAKSRKQSVSGLVVETVEKVLSSEDEGGIESRADLVRRVRELNDQVTNLSKDLQRYRDLVERQERELQDIRAGPFIDDEFLGGRVHPSALSNLLRERGMVKFEDLHPLLGITPGSDASKALQNQLGIMEQYGIIEYTDRHIRWKVG